MTSSTDYRLPLYLALKPAALTFQELLFRLQSFWAARGCVLQQPYDVEVGAGTMAPETFLRVLGPKPYRLAMRSLRGGRRMGAMARIRTGCSGIRSFS